MVPPATGFTRPLTTAESVSVPEPSTMPAEAVVAIVADAGGARTAVSVAALRAPVTAALFTSALEVARHRYVPACVGVNAVDVTGPPATGYGTASDSNTGGFAQVASFGP